MAQYDEYTRQFMEDVAADNPVISRESKFGLGALGSVIPKARPAVRALNRLIPTGEEKQAAAPSTVLNLYRILNDKFKTEWIDWEPETLWMELGEEGINVTDEIKNVVGALQVVANTFFPFEAWHIFENVAHAFAGNDVNFSIVQPLELTEAASAVKILTTIRPNTEFELEVLDYIAAIAKSSGVVYLPQDIFPGVQERLDGMNNDIALKSRVRMIYPRVVSGDSSEAIQTQKLDEIRGYLE